MAHREEAPYRPQDPQQVKELVQSLQAHQSKGKGKGGFSVRKATFELPNGRTVDSWRMQDWDYKKPNLPTYARGLFTYRTLDGKDEIAVRGYDKFFNHGEIRKTEWRNVTANTRGPYELSVKENGCIIFIAGLDDGTLLVCSKHSTGARADTELSHAQAGERWVEKHLASVGKTKADLARELRRMNATAVAELCDDAFEEHVLAYNPETAGLYLHGINLNLPEFVTYPGHLVDRFATEWGFKKTMYVLEDDIHKVKGFLDGVAETGAYAGRETEGFVIRCQARDHPDGPYEDWFFKYKFEEPYLMYRQWRECTRAIIANKPPKYKKHKKITEEYLEYVRRRFIKDPQLAKQYNQNHGIIKLRDEFLKERGLKGSDIIRQEIENGEIENREVTQHVVLVPVASIGCGKTTLALSLVKLFGWGHFQNDNITAKKGRPQLFAQAITNLLTQHPVVIADRNNHQKRERQQIIDDVSKIVPDAKFVALHYNHDRANYDKIRETMRNRIFERGDNHQTIQAGSKSKDEIIQIMEGFLHRFEPVDTSDAPDNAFDIVINLDPTSSTRENLETVVAQLNSEYPKLFGAMPSGNDLDNAVDAALNDYRPDVRVDLGRKGGSANGTNKQQQKQNQPQGKKEKPPKLEFFCIRLPADRVSGILEAMFRDQPPEIARFYRQLQQTRRLQAEFHVTLIHRASATQNQQHWRRLEDVHAPIFKAACDAAGNSYQEPELGKCKVQLERLLWDSRVMAFVVRILGNMATTVDGEHTDLWQTTNHVAHVTVGTASPDIKPKESNDLLARWLEGGSGAHTGINELMVKGNVELDGSVRGVLQRR